MLYKHGASVESSWCSKEVLIALGVIDEDDALDPKIENVYQFVPGFIACKETS